MLKRDKFFNKNKKRSANEDIDQLRESKCLRVKIDDSTMDMIDVPPFTSPSYNSNKILYQDDDGISDELKKLSLNNFETGINIRKSTLDTTDHFIFDENKKRSTNEDDDQSGESKCLRSKIDNSALDMINGSHSISPSSPSNYNNSSTKILNQDDNGILDELKKLSLNEVETGINTYKSTLNTTDHFIFDENKKCSTNEDDDRLGESKCLHSKIDDSTVDLINGTHSISPSSTSYYNNSSTKILNQDDNGILDELKKLSLNNVETGINICKSTLDTTNHLLTMRYDPNVAKNFSEFVPFIEKFIKLGEDVILLYEKAKHNKELCGFLLKRCNCVMAAVRDLDIRKTENAEFFSKKENLKLFKEFVECMGKIKKFVSRVSKLHKLIRNFAACNIEQDFNDLILEFDGYMRSLNFTFVVQSRNEISIMRNKIRQIKDMFLIDYGVSDDKQSLLEFFNRMNQLTMKNINYQTLTRSVIEDSSEVEANEPLLDGKEYQKSYIHTKKIEKRTLFRRCEEYCFKEFTNYNHTPCQIQIDIRRQVNILKELKDSDHIIRFYGVAEEDSKYYLVTEWMEYGNLHEYYTNYRELIDWKTKIKFALDICRGVAYLHECKVRYIIFW
jgi:hypothetical protein